MVINRGIRIGSKEIREDKLNGEKERGIGGWNLTGKRGLQVERVAGGASTVGVSDSSHDKQLQNFLTSVVSYSQASIIGKKINCIVSHS